MANFKVVISDPKTGKTFQKELEEEKANIFIGKKIGDLVDAMPLEMEGYKIKITGGTDKDGFPMAPFIPGGVRKAVILTKGFGFHPEKKGLRKKKLLRGNIITQEIVQINTMVTEYGTKPFEEFMPKKE
ncbi:MAG: 30S ribosomal protein S6e [Thermoplasmata archaeon]